VEKANGLILDNIKPRLIKPLERSAGCWVKELPSVLWSLHTTPNCSVSFTPFFLVYRAEAVLPTDIEFDAPRVVQYMEKQAKEAREDGINLLEEAREQALPDQRSISSSCDDTIAGRSVHSHFMKEISYSGWSKTPKACTSCPLPGRDRSLLAGC
jgi:hypothetical protein